MKQLVFLTALLLLAAGLTGGRCREPSGTALGKATEVRLRRPVALVATENGRRLFVANRCAGTVSVIDVNARQVISETAVGQLLADLADAGNDRLLAVDEAAGEMLVLKRDRERLTVAGRVRVGDTPVSVRALVGARAVVCCLWPRQLAVIDIKANERPRLLKRIDLPFVPRGLLVLPGGAKVIVADAFGGQLAVVDIERGVAESVRSVPGHNIRGLTLDGEGKRLLLTQQVLAAETPTRADDIRWGNVITNVVRSLSLDDVLKPDADLLRHSRLLPLGQFGQGAADPAGIVVVGGATVVALSGTGEIAVGPITSGAWRRVRVGDRPTAVAHSGHRIAVANTFSDTITVLDSNDIEKAVAISLGRTIAVSDRDPIEKRADISLGPVPELTADERGELLFFDARLSVEGWMSCHSCHSDGHTNGLRSDTLGDGSYETPKRVPTLLGVGDTAPWGWNGSKTRLEDQVRQSIQTTMRGSLPTLGQVADLTMYLRTLNPPPPRRGASSERAARRGETVFRARRCVRCHAPPTYTASKTYEVGLEDEAGKKAFNPPSLRGVGHGAAFFHDGRASRLEEVFTRYRHQIPADMPRSEIDDLLAFLRTL